VKIGPLIVALVAVALCVGLCTWLVISERNALDSDNAAWVAQRDSLIRAASDAEARANYAEAKMDSIKAHTDSVEAHRVPDTVYVPSVWRRVKLYDINVKMDSLKSL